MSQYHNYPFVLHVIYFSISALYILIIVILNFLFDNLNIYVIFVECPENFYKSLLEFIWARMMT